MRAEEETHAKDSVQFGFPGYLLERVLLQLPVGTAATALGLNHPAASVPNEAKVSNSTIWRTHMDYLELQRSIFYRVNESQRHSNEGLNGFTKQDF